MEGFMYKEYLNLNDLETIAITDNEEVDLLNGSDNPRYIELENNEFTEIELENVNTGDFTVNVKGVYGSFYKGETPYLEANDSPTHVFVGWTTDERINDICENFKTDDLIVSNEHIWNWETPLDRDMVIFAVYRKRKVYKVMIDFENHHSYFMVTYGEKTIMLSDKERDFIKVQEGHHFIVKCCPLISTNRNGEIIHTYNFYNWSDGNSYQTREYYADDNLFDDGILKLYAKCYEDKKSFNVPNEVIPTDDNFEMNLPVLNVLKKHVQQYVPNDNIIDFDKHKVNRYMILIKMTCHIYPLKKMDLLHLMPKMK